MVLRRVRTRYVAPLGKTCRGITGVRFADESKGQEFAEMAVARAEVAANRAGESSRGGKR